jgi:hypothetical protein
MAYDVDQTNVTSEVATFSEVALRYWMVCVAEIAVDPYPRFGSYVESIVPIRGFPLRTYLYEITREVSVSGEEMYVFTAEFFPEYLPLYVIDEGRLIVRIIYLRENRRA